MCLGGADMENDNEIVRKSIRMSQEVANWYEERAKKLGVSQSNLMIMALAEYIKQDKTMDVMSNLKGMMEELSNLSEEK